nr:hypothetical protein [Tanacetum cinerariifolium]
GPIPGMRPGQALTAIQTMIDHSQKWHNGSCSKNIRNISNSDGITPIVRKLDNLGRDIKKLKENQHVDEALVRETMKSLKKIRINCPFLKNRQSDNYAQHLENQVANKPKTKENNEVKMNPMCSALLQNQLPLKKHDPRSFIIPCSIGRLDFNNALADLGASINIMPFSMYKHLGMEKLESINMMIEMADITKRIPKGVVKNLLIRIDKFNFRINFVILDMIKDFKMPIILGRPLLATTHAKVDIFRKSISLKVGNEKVIFKMRSSFTTTIFESNRAIKSKIHMGDDNLIDSEYCEFDQLLGIEPDIFAHDVDI